MPSSGYSWTRRPGRSPPASLMWFGGQRGPGGGHGALVACSGHGVAASAATGASCSALRSSTSAAIEFCYPRTESTAYPASFDFRSVLSTLSHNPLWSNNVRTLMDAGFVKPRQGHDVGDHPPITPMRLAPEEALETDAWRLYQYICQHFIGTVSHDCRYTRTAVEFASGGEIFRCVGHRVTSKGFTSIMPWLAVGENNLPTFKKGDTINIHKVDIYEGSTTAPDYLSESELISLMEKNGIGTDASIPVHINNISERNYVQVNSGRRLVPTALGTTLIRGYQCIDADLCLPDIRSFIEQQITLIAKGKADHLQVIQHSLQQFMRKYSYFVKKVVYYVNSLRF